MGYGFGSQCYPTQAQAYDAYYASFGNKLISLNSSSDSNAFLELVYLPMYSGAWVRQAQRCTMPAGATSLSCTVSQTLAPAYSWIPCTDPNDPLTNFTDGATLGWGVVLAMVLAWGIAVLKRGT